MGAWTWTTQHRGLLVALLVVTVVVAVAAGFIIDFMRGEATPVALKEALRSFRREPSDQVGPRRGLPGAGVYLYRTTGHESLSLPGTARSFPSSSVVVVTDRGCGVDVSWPALVEHVESFVACAGPVGGLRLVSSSATVSFAGITTTQTTTCSAQAMLWPARASVGHRWSATCTAGQVHVALHGRVVGFPTLEVGGRPVPTVHTVVTLAYSGSQTGSSPTDYWFALDDSLLVRERETSDVVEGSGPLGAVTYRETATLVLESPVPRR